MEDTIGYLEVIHHWTVLRVFSEPAPGYNVVLCDQCNTQNIQVKPATKNSRLRVVSRRAQMRPTDTEESMRNGSRNPTQRERTRRFSFQAPTDPSTQTDLGLMDRFITLIVEDSPFS